MHFVHLNEKRDSFRDRNTRQYFRDMFLFNLKSDPCFRRSGTDVDSSFIPKGGVGYRVFPIDEPSPEAKRRLVKEEKSKFFFIHSRQNQIFKIC